MHQHTWLPIWLKYVSRIRYLKHLLYCTFTHEQLNRSNMFVLKISSKNYWKWLLDITYKPKSEPNKRRWRHVAWSDVYIRNEKFANHLSNNVWSMSIFRYLNKVYLLYVTLFILKRLLTFLFLFIPPFSDM